MTTPEARARVEPDADGRAGKLPLLFLMSDTGGGHRRAAEAVCEALHENYPGQFEPVLCDPLAGPGSAWPLRWLTRLYGPAIRRAPWVWGAAYYVSNSRAAMAVLWRTVFAFANAPVVAAAAAARPAVIVSCHPLTGRAAVLAASSGLGGSSGPGGGSVPVLTVVTDLAGVHASWYSPQPDHVAVPTGIAVAQRVARGIPPGQRTDAGLPVAALAQSGPLPADARAALRRRLGLAADDFVVLVTGGGEGCGRLARQTAGILRRFPAARVVTICGRNDRLLRRLSDLARRRGAGRLTALGYVGNAADWLRCADVLVTKAGPGIIAEAACCGTPMLLTSHLPGQERGNTRLVLTAGAGRTARGVRGMLRELDTLRADPALLAALQAGSRRLARPAAAAVIAGLVADLAGVRPAADIAAIAGGRRQDVAVSGRADARMSR